jgi:hypothetical protein
VHHRERRERHRRGSHRHRRRPDVHPVRRRGDRDVLLRGRDVPNESASHPDWGEEAWSPGWAEVRPDPVRDGGRPVREPDERRLPVRPGGVRPVREPVVRRRGAEHRHRERVAEPVVPPEPTSTDCFRRAEPSGRAWGQDQRAWGRPEPTLLPRPTRQVPARPEQRVLPDEGWAQPVPAWAQRPVPTGQRELPQRATVLPELALRVPVQRGPRARPGGMPAWVRDEVHSALLRRASRRNPTHDLLLRDRWVLLHRTPARPRLRTGRIHEVDEPRGLRLWMMRT